MCTLSNIGDYWGDSYRRRYPQPSIVQPWVVTDWSPVPSNISQEEFNKLKAEVEALRKLLEAAKEFDEATDQPNCEVDPKVALIKAVAEALGVDMSTVFK